MGDDGQVQYQKGELGKNQDSPATSQEYYQTAPDKAEGDLEGEDEEATPVTWHFATGTH
ncbi:UNVERIFIED_CONTAM: hypothetical protein FKN15_067708 [Acipenser sinensis]